MTRWPYPGDTPLVRARKLLHSCRAMLYTANANLGRQFDEMAVGFGETWVVPKVITTTDDDLLTPGQAADFLCVGTSEIRRLRLAGRLAGVKDRAGNWRYRVAALRALQEGTRRRTGRVSA